MLLKLSDRIAECLARATEARERARTATDTSRKVDLLEMERRWLQLAESYRFLEQADRFLNDAQARIKRDKTADVRSRDKIGETATGASITQLLELLVSAAIQHSDGKARAAFYRADVKGIELHHIIGMPDAYAKQVNGFAISPQSLACGLAAAARKPVITPDVTAEPLWQPWLWLAKEFDYRACWSFPVESPTGEVLGTFAMYYKDPTEATTNDLDFAAELTRTAATIISLH